jgi:hypothetical protein
MCIKKRKEKDEFLKFILKQVTHFFSFKFYEEMRPWSQIYIAN